MLSLFPDLPKFAPPPKAPRPQFTARIYVVPAGKGGGFYVQTSGGMCSPILASEGAAMAWFHNAREMAGE